MNREGKSREKLFTDPEEIVTFAQAYYATEFPNDEPRDCPSIESLRKAARASTPPDEQLRAHLFNCSECFRSYRSARMDWQAQAEPAGRWHHQLDATLVSLRAPWVIVTAGAFSLIFLGLITVALLRHTSPNSPAVAVNHPPQGNSPAAPPKVSDAGAPSGGLEPVPIRPRPDLQAAKASTGAIKRAARNKRSQPSARVIYVDLKEDDLLRGDDNARPGRRVISLSAERQRLRLRMPRGSVAGRYTVKVVDAYGKPVLATAARSGGRMLTVELDLRGLTAKLYRLCLSRAGEAPDCYLMSIGEKSSAP